ncbi:MAG: hypothetical protein JZU50_05240 [Desulfobulbaceae bacterium]|nr:hypothetical protein [Desulfobulbaceae bacterium]
MAKQSLVTILALVMVIAGWFAYDYFSDKEVIKRQLFGLAVEIGKEGQEPPMKLALKMGNVKKMMAKSCMVTVPERGYNEILEPDVTIQYLIYYRNRFNRLAVTLDDMVVDVSTKERAGVQVAVSVKRLDSVQTETIKKDQLVELNLVKSDKKWLIHKVVLAEALLD